MAKTRDIVARAMKDEGFRNRLLQDAKGTIQSEFGIHFPNDVSVNVHQNSESVINIVLPTPIDMSSRTLSEAELAAVAGGLASKKVVKLIDTEKCAIEW
jgi:hypothetical protein